MRAKAVAAVIGGAFALVALTAGAAQAGHHQTHSVPVTEETVTGGPYKPTGDVLNNPSPLG